MRKLLKIFILSILLNGCKQPFESPVSKLSKDVLCIDGFINTGSESSVITLTKLQDLGEKSTILPELKALVSLQEEGGSAVALVEEGKGNYTLAPRAYNSSKRYRLEITRSNGKKYQSAFVKLTTTPPIDKLTYQLNPNGVIILLDAQNANDASRYYYWEQEETWLFSVPYPSKYELIGDKFVKRTLNLQFCYRTEKSNKLILGSTAALTENKVNGQEIQFVDRETGKISLIYSVNVRQHAIDKDYFEYLQKIKNNTEAIGSIFDAQPTQNISNVFSANDPQETVVGFFNMHSVQQKRMFIKIEDLPPYLRYTHKECDVQEIPFWVPQSSIYNYPEDYFRDTTKLIPIEYVEKLPRASYVTGTAPVCADCRVTGVLEKPSFWPY
jgi:hypothetical protein